MKIKVSIITSMYNRSKSTIDVIDNLFFPSLLNNASKDTEVIILDDASPMKKETALLVKKYFNSLKKSFGRVIFKRNVSNLGFAGSFDKGIALARGEKLFIVNDDLYLPKGSVFSLINTLYENNKYGLIGPITNQADTWSYQYCKQAPKISSYSKKEYNLLEKFAQLAKKIMKGKRINVEIVTGFCFAVDASKIREYGGFDKSFKNGGFEDIDLVNKMKKKYLMIVNPEVFVYHGGLGGSHMSLN
ncbi:MAG: glycosyltransferase, partial [Candidatus Pacearchaeota archaeon]